jgi:hypothetical protein
MVVKTEKRIDTPAAYDQVFRALQTTWGNYITQNSRSAPRKAAQIVVSTASGVAPEVYENSPEVVRAAEEAIIDFFRHSGWVNDHLVFPQVALRAADRRTASLRVEAEAAEESLRQTFQALEEAEKESYPQLPPITSDQAAEVLHRPVKWVRINAEKLGGWKLNKVWYFDPRTIEPFVKED